MLATVQQRIHQLRNEFVRLIRIRGIISAGSFDNRPTWDNTGGSFDNRPTWDNWNKH
ncbi:MAG: multiple cyclophane-containing RiPP AmcA [Gammaproteobacteria bacterium]